jgi:hypothetical protein
VLLDREVKAARELDDRLLKRLVVERDEHAAAVTDQVMMVLIATRVCVLVTRDTVTNFDLGHQIKVVQQLKRAVDAGAGHGPPAGAGCSQLGLDALRGQRALLRCEQLDQRLTRGTPVVPGALDDLACTLCPLLPGHVSVYTSAGSAVLVPMIACSRRCHTQSISPHAANQE